MVRVGLRERQREEIREVIRAAAIPLFAERGFDGAGLREIAERADVLQPQINYHFGSKLGLWQDVIGSLVGGLAQALAPVVAADLGPRDRLAQAIRAFIRYSARHPELQRIILHESTQDGDRLTWLVDTHVGPLSDLLLGWWEQIAREHGAAPVPLDLAHHLLVGAGALPYTSFAELRLLRRRHGGDIDGPQITDELLDAHADLLIAAFLPAPSLGH